MRGPSKLGRRWQAARILSSLTILSGWILSCNPIKSPSRLAHSKAEARPNLVFLLADDQRFDALGAAGNGIIKTPRLDELAREGVLFVNAFCTTSICPTSRASFATGQYASRHGIEDFATPLSPQQFAESWLGVLKQAGYRTAFVGKWGLGGPLPDRSFDFWRGFAGGGRDLKSENGEERLSDEPGHGDYFAANREKHLTAALGEAAVEFLEAQDPSRPFVLQLSFKAPHAQDGAVRPYPYDPRYAELLVAAEMPLATSATEAAFNSLPEILRESEGRVRWAERLGSPASYQTSVKGYYRLIAGIDEVVGQLRTVLDQKNLSENTVFVFSSDNGLLLGEHGLTGKWLMYEESIRIPLIVYDPRLPTAGRGKVVSDMVLNIDLAPTMLDLAGASIPETMQGKSLRPLLTGQNTNWRNDWYYEHRFQHPRIPRAEGVRTDRWKYVIYHSGKESLEQLFDLRKDPLELLNLAADRTSVDMRQQMRRRLEKLRLLASGKARPTKGVVAD